MAGLLLLLAVIIVGWVALNAVAGLIGILFTIAIWMLIGYLVGQLVRGKGYGPIGDIALGLIGGMVGSVVLAVLPLNLGGFGVLSTIMVGVFGSLILIFGVRLIANDEFAK